MDDAQEVATFDQYCSRRGVDSFAPMDAGMHSGRAHVSGAANRAAERLILNAHEVWMARREALRLEYAKRLADGSIRPPTRVERLRATARGEGEAAAAAQRLLDAMATQGGTG